MNLAKEFSENDIIFLITSMEEYQEDLSSSLKRIDDGFQKICYMSFIKDGKAMTRLLEKTKIDAKKFIFIQTVSESEKIKDSFYAGRMNELTKISITYTSVLSKMKPESVFNDSVSTLFIHEDENTILKFIISIINKTRASGTKIIFLIAMDEKYTSSIKELYMYSDKIVDLRKMKDN